MNWFEARLSSMMVTMDSLKIGDYAKFVGHNIQERYAMNWWKVTAIEGNTVLLIDRTGGTGRLPRNRRYQDLRANRWEPAN